MILNLMRVEGINPEYILERSFFQFQNRAKLPVFLDEYERLHKECSEIKIDDEKTMTKYYDIKTELEEKKEELRRYVYQPFYVAPFLQPGRLVKMKGMEGERYDWGVVLGHHGGGKGKGGRDGPIREDDGTDLTVDMIVAKAESQPEVQYRSPKYGWTVTLRDVEVVSLPVANLLEMSVLRIEQPKDMRKKEQRLRISKSLEEISKRFPDGIPVLDPRIDLRVDEGKLDRFEAEVRKQERKLKGVVGGEDLQDPTQFELYSKKRELRKQRDAVSAQIKEAVSLIHMDELKRRKRVLRRLEYCTEKDVILMKGRVACELSSVDELVMTELLFSGVLNDLSPNEVTALLSVFVCDERSNETPKIPENLQMPLRKLKEITDRVLKTSIDAMLDLNEELYTSQFKPYLIQVVLSWTTGIPFAEICKMTDFFEGSIIRCLRRLEELLRQLVQVAKKVGNVVLEAKFSTGITLIKRDIVFAASLYL
jgi:ATP-dependent RNA helicase DOB1